MKMAHALLALSLCVHALIPAQAQTGGVSAADKDYCGSGFTEKWVPDQLFGCKMTNACQAHDVCYGKCDPGGSRYATPYCQKSEFSVPRFLAKMTCDGDFLSAIAEANKNQWQCNALAGIYTTAVVFGGQGPFNGRPISNESLKDLVETSVGPAEAIAKFTELAKLSQYNQIDLSRIQRKGSELEVLTLTPQTVSPTGSFLLPKGMKDIDIKGLMKRQNNPQN